MHDSEKGTVCEMSPSTERGQYSAYRRRSILLLYETPHLGTMSTFLSTKPGYPFLSLVSRLWVKSGDKMLSLPNQLLLIKRKVTSRYFLQ